MSVVCIVLTAQEVGVNLTAHDTATYPPPAVAAETVPRLDRLAPEMHRHDVRPTVGTAEIPLAVLNVSVVGNWPAAACRQSHNGLLTCTSGSYV
jgi:hypothetical protein